ncbi:hypothetical protein CASFOL_025475 [Castilleja foliolosa]|uniref:Glycosyltransferase 61 catalytic domain-containing protein n=1 Tax=Castilleja foliolosa TaxID=1961234 RepID=A0ABD3CT33_9LAMI
MLKYQRKDLYFQWKKSKQNLVEEDEGSFGLDPFGIICKNSVFSRKIAKPKILYFIFLFLTCCCLVLAPLLYCFGASRDWLGFEADVNDLLCSSVTNGTIWCDRTSPRSDTCFIKGDIRTRPDTSSIFLYDNSKSNGPNDPIRVEKIRPYPRKWESNVMDKIGELDLVQKRKPDDTHHTCDVRHDVPAVFFSTGGYTGNLYHDFNEGILPLYITSQHFNKRVVFVILQYRNWWIKKYGNILSQLSDFPAIDFTGDKRAHCFPEAIVGLRIHKELTIDNSKLDGNKTIGDFHDLLNRAYLPRISKMIDEEEREDSTIKKIEKTRDLNKPKLVIVSRNGSRAITNEDLLVRLAEDIGFLVEVLRPESKTELAKLYRVLNSSDVMVGVHGAAMTHFLFMKPSSVFIQIVPLGTEWAADTCYGLPSRKFGLRYIEYQIRPKESSLYDDYDKNDPILVDPSSVNSKGWASTKRVYLDLQTVRLDLRRFRKRLLRAYYFTLAKKNGLRLGRFE